LTFSNLNLQDSFVASIEAAGYVSPTKLQSQLIPLIGDRKSAVVWSQSAAGKTGAFLIPAVNYILANPLEEKRGARILILTSRRDRVSQINYTLKRLTRDHNMRFGFIVSGRPYQPQMRLMRRPLDMMVATPGRLNDLVDNNKADFSQLEMLIIDDMTTIFQKNMHDLIGKILSQVNKECPTVAFVRHDPAVNSLVKKLFPGAIEIESQDDESEELDVSDDNPNIVSQPVQRSPKESATLAPSFPSHEQHAYVADDYTHKIALMDHFLDEFAGEPTVIHTATTKTAKALQENLSNHGHVVELAHELKSEEISPTDTPTLIVSDQKLINLPKGSDKNTLHFDLPYKLDNYRSRLSIHEESRESAMLILADGNDYDALRRIEKEIGSPIEQKTAPGLEPLNPFISTQATRPRKPNTRKPSNSSTAKKTSKQARPNQARTNKGRTARPSAKKPAGAAAGKPKITHAARKKTTSKSTSTDEKDTRRQRKGPYGRLNGGAQRKRNDFGVSSVGTKNNQPAQMANSEWDKAIADNKPSKEPRVVIRYKDKKRTLQKDDSKPDA
jgi:superfamily II DNA/RNA helicase